MGLTQLLSRRALASAHVLLVEVPGSWPVRVRAEQVLRGRGWRVALSPADADVLAVCGSPGDELAEVIDRLWGQMPGPRARVAITSAAGVEDAFARAERDLGDLAVQEQDARHRPATPEAEAESRDEDHEEHEDHEDHEKHGDHGDHGDHGGMDDGDMDMAPGGIPLAEGGEDRDGLEMDVLHVRLGPVLPHWPAGLVVRCTLQGDVISRADARMVDADHHPAKEPPPHPRGTEGPQRLARRCDRVADLLALAGWEDGAARARRLRDAVLDEADVRVSAQAEELARRARRSWPLRWSLRGLGHLRAEELEEHALPLSLRGDAYDRLVVTLASIAEELSAHADQDEGSQRRSGEVGLAQTLVTGLDLATARLVVASLDLDLVDSREGASRA